MPAEDALLSDFLLSPASLPTAMSLQQFSELFPKRLRDHPQIKALYQELQQLREQDMAAVGANIDAESQRGDQHKAELRSELLRSGVDGLTSDDQRDINADAQLFGDPSAESPDNFHSVDSLLAAMDAACDTIEQEIDSVDKSASSLLSDLTATVGDLSDLRYGKMQGPAESSAEAVDEAKKGLKNLEEGCYRE